MVNDLQTLTRSDVAALLGITVAALDKIRERARIKGKDGRREPFPEPFYVGRTPLWNRYAIDQWRARDLANPYWRTR